MAFLETMAVFAIRANFVLLSNAWRQSLWMFVANTLPQQSAIVTNNFKWIFYNKVSKRNYYPMPPSAMPKTITIAVRPTNT